MRPGTAQPREREEPDPPVLAALRDELRRQVDGRRGAEVLVAVVQFLRVRRRVVADELRLRREDDHGVAPVGVAVPGRIARRHEELAAARDDDRARASPDRRVARRAPRRHEEMVRAGAERVPDVQEPAVPGGDDDYVPLVGRCVADVAAGRGDDVPAGEVERGGDLLARGQLRDQAPPAGVTGRNRELLDPSVRRRRVDPPAAGIGNRSGGRDLRRARPVGVARRGPTPQDLPVRRVDRERDPVGRRHEERVVGRAADRDATEVDRRGVDRSREPDLLPPQRADVRGRDPGRVRVVVAAARVPAEAGPVTAGGCDRLMRASDAACRTAAPTRSEHEHSEGEGEQQGWRRSRTRDHRPPLPG